MVYSNAIYKKKWNGLDENLNTLQNKVVVLTTEWLAWLQTNWRNSTELWQVVGWRILRKATREASAQFLLQPQYTDNPQNICEGVITNALQSCSKELLCKQVICCYDIVSVLWL